MQMFEHRHSSVGSLSLNGRCQRIYDYTLPLKNASLTLKLSKIDLPVNLIGIREVPFPAITICPSVNSKWKAIGEILQNLDKNDSIVKTFNQFPREFKVNGSFSLSCF